MIAKITKTMNKVTYEMFKSLFDYLVDKGVVKVEGNNINVDDDEIVKSVFAFFTMGSMADLKGYAEHKLWQFPEFGVFEYYLLYYHCYDKEPFDLMELINNHIEVGATYGWRGNPYMICLSKNVDGNKVKVSFMRVSGIPGPVEEEEYEFNVNDYKSFENNAYNLTMTFGHKNMQHPDLIESLQNTISACEMGLEAINKIKDEYNAQREKMEKVYINGKEMNLY